MKSQLVIQQGEEQFQVPIEDMAVLILDEPMITISHPLLAKLAEENIVLLTSDERHSPIGLHFPLYNHSTPSLYWKEQITISRPLAKQIWQQLIQAKISGQANILEKYQKDATPLKNLALMVKSGDSENIEAQAARIYWQTLFGGDFIRGRYEGRENSALNYGYALIRSALARAVVGAGLMPMIGIWHDNQYNPFNLVDDLIEPLRPMVDNYVMKVKNKHDTIEKLTPEIKRDLCSILTDHLIWDNKEFDLFVTLTYYCANFRDILVQGGIFQTPKIIID